MSKRGSFLFVVVVIILMLFLAASYFILLKQTKFTGFAAQIFSTASPIPSASPSPTSSPIASPTASPSLTASPTPSPTQIPTATPTEIPTASATATPTPEKKPVEAECKFLRAYWENTKAKNNEYVSLVLESENCIGKEAKFEIKKLGIFSSKKIEQLSKIVDNNKITVKWKAIWKNDNRIPVIKRFLKTNPEYKFKVSLNPEIESENKLYVEQGILFGASISINANKAISEVNPFIYGNNLVWGSDGTHVWDIKDPENYEDDSLNMVMIEKIKEINPTTIRFPGGGYAHAYHWNNTIGPRAKRPPDTLGPGGPLHNNSFGVDEFMLFVREINAEPMLTVNTLTGTAKEAAAWVAYMNGATSSPIIIGVDENGHDWKNVSYWATERAKNGHPEPYDVKYWEIGNEDYWFSSNNTYYTKFENFAREMKKIDPTIKTGAVAQRQWRRNNAWELWYGPTDKTNFDFAVYHYYPTAPPYKYETLFANTQTQNRNFTPAQTEEGTYKFKLNLGGSDTKWICKFSMDNKNLNDNNGNRINFTTFPVNPTDPYDSYTPRYTSEFNPNQLSHGPHNFSIGCYSGSSVLYLRDVLLLKKVSETNFETYDELSYNTLENSSMGLWAEPKNFTNFLADYRKNINSPETQITVTEFNVGGYDREFVSLKESIFIADLLLQMIKNNTVDLAHYWHLSGYSGAWTGMIDYQNITKNRPNFLVYKLLNENIRGQILETQVSSQSYNFKGTAVPYIETIATENNKKLFVAIINKNLSDSATVSINIAGFEPAKKAKVYVLNAPALDSDNEEADNVVITESEIEVAKAFDYIAEPHSLAVIEISPFAANKIVRINMSVEAEETKKISKINVFKNGSIIGTKTCNNKLCEYVLENEIDSYSYIYAEAIQSDGNKTYSSPVYVAPEQAASIPTQENYILVWGDLHGHTSYSDGQGTPAQYYAFCRDNSKIDFCALTDHDFELDNSEWQDIKKQAEDFTSSNFVAISGFEWSYGDKYGHKIVYFRNNNAPSICSYKNSDCDTPSKLFQFVKNNNALSHQAHPMSSNTNWSSFDELAQPNAEIFKDWPYNFSDNRTINYALSLGYKIGLVGVSDAHKLVSGEQNSQPGKGALTGCWVKALTREEIFDALKNRRCYATWYGNKRIKLKFSVNEHFMGEEFGLTLPGCNNNIIEPGESCDPPGKKVCEADKLKTCSSTCQWDIADCNSQDKCEGQDYLDFTCNTASLSCGSTKETCSALCGYHLSSGHCCATGKEWFCDSCHLPNCNSCRESECSTDCLKEIGCTIDSDKDGVSDSVDKCLTPIGKTVNEAGCTVPLFSNFQGKDTTNFSELDLNKVENLTLDSEDGKILFAGKVNIVGVDFDKNINITKDSVFVNITSLSQLNVSAEITLYSISFVQPKILVENDLCVDCSIISYTNNILVFNVSHFTLYKVVEGYTQPIQQNNGGGSSVVKPKCKQNWTLGNWQSCQEGNIQYRDWTDINKCNNNTGKPGMLSRTCDFCVPNWQCTEWSACLDSEQTRECKDLSSCNEDETKPVENQDCPEKEKPKPTYWIYIIVIFSILVLIILVVIILISREKGGVGKTKKTELEKAKKDILEDAKLFVENSLKRGYTKEQIKIAFLNKGWRREDIEKLFGAP